MRSSRQLIKKLMAVGVSLFFLIWLLRDSSLTASELFTPLFELPIWLISYVFFGLLTTYLLRGWRVAYEFRSYEKLSIKKCIQIVLWHNASVNLMPMRSGELVFPLLLQRVAQVPIQESLTSLLFLRFQDACTVLMLCLVFWPTLELHERFLLGLVVIAAAWIFQHWAKSPSTWHESSLGIKKRLAPLREALARGLPHAKLSWLLTVTNWLIKISVQALLYCHLLGVEFPLGVTATISTEFAAFSPLQGIAGIGTFEASSALAMRSQGIPWIDGIQVAAQVHMIMLSSAIFWALISLYEKPSSIK